MKDLTASDRKRLLKLATSLPKGSPERRAILAGLKKALYLPSNPDVIEHLNKALRRELTVVNQYMVQHALCDNWGYKKLSQYFKVVAISEMKHAEELIERIVFLDGVPDVSLLNEVFVGETVPEMIANDKASEEEAIDLYSDAIAFCREVGDNGTREFLESFLKDEEVHQDWSAAQLDQIEAVGLPNYLAAQL